jgi:elongation factor P
MHTDDYSQIELQKNALDRPELMKEGEVVTILINSEDGMPLSVDMPASVILEVTHTEPGVKGNTATNATKPATVETGATVNVPLFINEGDKIKVETEKGTYKERIKE